MPEPAGGGLGAAPVAGEADRSVRHPNSRLWRYLQNFSLHTFQTTMFQPVGGMDMIGKAFGGNVGDLIRYDAKVTRDPAGRSGVTVTYVDAGDAGGAADGEGRLVRLHHPALDPEPDPDRCRHAHEGRDRRGALRGLGQDRLAVQAPVLGRGRGDLRRHQLHRPADPADRLSEHRLQPQRQGRAAGRLSLRAARTPTNSPRWRRPSGSRALSTSAPASIRNTAAEFENGIAVAWHRVPFTLGCAGDWTEAASAPQHYDDLCQIDGRIVLAGEHASYIPAWQEGAILSALDAITRLHERVVKT